MFKIIFKHYLLFYISLALVLTMIGIFLSDVYTPSPESMREKMKDYFPFFLVFILGFIYPKKFWLGTLIMISLGLFLSSITDWIKPGTEHNLGPITWMLGIIMTILYLIIAGFGALIGYGIQLLVKKHFHHTIDKFISDQESPSS